MAGTVKSSRCVEAVAGPRSQLSSFRTPAAAEFTDGAQHFAARAAAI